MALPSQQSPGYGFVFGLMAGTFVGAAVTLWLVPRAAGELRERVTDSARALGRRASQRYDEAGAAVGSVVGELARKGNDIRNDAADSVARGAHAVERMAVAVKSDGARPRA